MEAMKLVGEVRWQMSKCTCRVCLRQPLEIQCTPARQSFIKPLVISFAGPSGWCVVHKTPTAQIRQNADSQVDQYVEGEGQILTVGPPCCV